MATTVTIKSDTTEASRTIAEEAKAQTFLLDCYIDQGLGPADVDEQTMLLAIIDWWMGLARDKAVLRRAQTARDAATKTAEDDLKFEWENRNNGIAETETTRG